jgi:hypothetical protein
VIKNFLAIFGAALAITTGYREQVTGYSEKKAKG